MKKTSIAAIALCLVFIGVPVAFAQNMRPNLFEQKVVEFTQRVLDGQQYDFLKAKNDLAEDLYKTPYAQDFESKVDSVRRYSRGLSFSIEDRLTSCKSADEFKAVKDRYAEWNDFTTIVDHATEDYSKGIIKDLFTNKQREEKMPFEIKSVKWEQNTTAIPNIEDFKKELSKAEKVLASALSALRSKDENAFAGFFPEKMQLLRKALAEHSEIHKIYENEVANYWKKDMDTDLAPPFIRADLEEAASLYKKDNVIKTVIRRWNGKEVNVHAVLMAKEDGKNYIIKQWSEGSFDMDNRRR